MKIGSQERRINIVPDYLLEVDTKFRSVVDAKAPSETILNSPHVEQVYSYAIHPDVRAETYALCNGRKLVVYEIDESSPVLDVEIQDMQNRWDEIVSHLSPESFRSKDIARSFFKARESEIQKQIGELLRRERIYKEQIRTLTAAVSALSSSPTPREQLDLALTQLEHGNIATAKIIFKEVLERGAEDAHAAAGHLGAITFFTEPEEAIKAYELATSLDPRDLYSWNQLGHLLKRVGRLDEALKAYSKLITVGHGHPKNVATAVGNIGDIYRMKGDHAAAISKYNESLEISELIQDDEGKAIQRCNLGNMYREIGDVDRSESESLQSLEMAERNGQKEVMAATLGNLGLVCFLKERFREAGEYYWRSLRIDENIGNNLGIARQYGNLGLLYAREGDRIKAEDSYKRSLELAEKLDSKETMAAQYGNLATLYSMAGNCEEAGEYFHKALENHRLLDNKREIAQTYNNIGLNSERADNLALAVEAFENAKAIFGELNDPYANNLQRHIDRLKSLGR